MKITIRRLVFLAWIAWFATVGAMSWLSFARILHPNFLYMAVPLAVMVAYTILAFFAGIWRIFRGPNRLRAAVWLFLSAMPALWTAAYVGYLLHFASGRNHSPNFFVSAGMSLSSLIGEPYVRWAYPYRYEGERFVAFSESPKFDEKQMAAMDEHLRAMEKTLGGRSEYKAYWIRGPVWGFDGRYVFGYSLGWAAGKAENSGGLRMVDRHEVAHFALDQLLPRMEYVPMLLFEGWAEVNSGPDEQASDERRFEQAMHGRTLLSLRELTSPGWYSNSDGPVYFQGRALVDYLLRHYGAAKFLELCRICRPETFPDDVKRVLGVSLDELDEDYQADAAEREKPEPTDREKLLALKVGENVASEKWEKFFEDYCAGISRLRAAYRRSSVKWTTRQENVIDDASGERFIACVVEQYDCDGERLAATSCRTGKSGSSRGVHVVTPEVEFILNKAPGDASWGLTWHKASKKGRKHAASFFENSVNRPDFEMVLRPLGEISRNWTDTKIVEIGKSADHPDCIRVSWEVGEEPNCRGWWDLDPKRDYVLIEERFESIDRDVSLGAGRTTVEYEEIGGVPVMKAATVDYQPKGHQSQSRTLKLESCKFGPPPAEIFELSHYGQFDPQAIKTVFPPVPPTYIGILFWVAAGWTILGLVMAVLAKCLGRASEKGKMDEIRKFES